MSKNFPVMSGAGTLLRFLGGLGLVIALIYAIVTGVLEPLKEGHSFGINDIIDLGMGMVGAVLSLFVMAFGEIVGVLFAIEANTRQQTLKKDLT